MMYRGILEIDQGHDAVWYAVAETIFWVVVWCVLEAWVFEGLIDFVADFLYGVDRLLSWFYLPVIGHFLSWAGDIFGFFAAEFERLFRYLGKGDFEDWLRRAMIMWFCTGLPMFLWQMSVRDKEC